MVQHFDFEPVPVTSAGRSDGAKPVRRKSGMRNAECGKRKAEGGMRNAERGRRNAECGEGKAECGERKARAEVLKR